MIIAAGPGRNPAACVGLLVALSLTACADGGEAGFATYSGDEYGFRFSYPDTLDLREYTPTSIALGRSRGNDGFDAVVEVVLDLGEEGVFEEFAVDRARTSCAADGPDLSLSCTEVLESRPFATAGGADGIVFRLRHIATRPGDTTVLESRTRGPFYALDVSGVFGSSVGVLFVRPPTVLEAENVEQRLLLEVATSVDFDRLSTSRPDTNRHECCTHYPL